MESGGLKVDYSYFGNWGRQAELHGNTQSTRSGIALTIDNRIIEGVHVVVSVMHGAECNIDHKMLRMRLVVGAKKIFHRSRAHEDLLCLGSKAEVWMTKVR